MSIYQPFLIAGLKTAKSIGLEPWLSPQDAFPTIENAFVNKGIFEKRRGFSPFAQMKHGSTLQTVTPITGIHTYLKNGMPSLLIMDTRRANYYNAVDGSMTDVSSSLASPAKIFNGSASDFFSFLNWRGVGYMVNNVDQVYQWSGPGNAVVPFNIQLSSDTKTNHIDTCQYIFVIDDRLVLLGPVEFGDWFPQRLRYGPVLQTDFTQPGSGSDDAETQERISAAGMIGKTVFAFFDGPGGGSLWKIRRTGNTDIPLEWERVTATEGSPSPYSGIEFKDGLVAVGTSDILFTEGSPVRPIQFLGGPNLRDILTEFNNDKIRSVFGYKQKEIGQNHLLFTFADSTGSTMNRILDFNIPENNWTVHKSEQSFFVNMIGGFNGQKVPSFIELDDVLKDMGFDVSDPAIVSEITVDSRAVLGSPSPFTLIGCRNSRVYKWNDGDYDGTDDASGKINWNALSGRWNPFTKTGQRVACQKIGLLVDNDDSASFTISVYKNTGSVAYKTKVISCDSADDTVDKFWVWIFCDGEIGDFHRLQISHTEKGNSPKIHAFQPYFAAAGRLSL